MYRPAPGTIPTEPGVYRFRDAHGRVIYVGKAKSLRSRLSNYFQTNLPVRTAQIAIGIEWPETERVSWRFERLSD